MTGQIFDRLTVVSRDGTSPDRKALWLCQCICGRAVIAKGVALRSGHTRSCGCLATEGLTQRNFRHGGAGTRLHDIWKDMHKRCRSHPHYAGRVRVNRIWDTFPPFRDWALTHGYHEDLTLDRKNTLGHYAPGNCRWATRLEQANNRYDQQGGYEPAT
jgi:hypothetical protein